MDFIRRRLFRKINVFLAVILLISAAVFAYTLLNPDERDFKADEPEMAVEKSEPESNPLQHYSEIEESGLFGRRREPERPARTPAPEPRAPELKLKGTVLFASGGGYAIIQDGAAGKEETVREGGSISGMELVSIGWNSAVLTGGQGEITLEIEPDAAQPAGRTAAERPAGRPGRESFTVPFGRVEEAIENAPELLREIDVRPNISGGRTEGFIVSGIRPGSLPDEFGLKDGDIITSINRTNLDGPENMMRAYSEVMRRGFAAVEIMRGGERINLRYRIER